MNYPDRLALTFLTLFLTPFAFAAPPPHDFDTHSTRPALEHVFLDPKETGAAFAITAVKPQCGCTVTQG